MAKKNFSLDQMIDEAMKIQNDTRKTQDKKSKFEKYRKENQENKMLEKKKKEKRINMAFSNSIYNYILEESSMLGVGIGFFINEILRNTNDQKIENYYNGLAMKPNKNYIPRHKGYAQKRITIKFDEDIYTKVILGAAKYNQTITQYVNMVFNCNTRNAQ